MRRAKMGHSIILITGLITSVFTNFHAFGASHSCAEEMAGLREQEVILKSKVLKQELLIHRLKQQIQPQETKPRPDIIDTDYKDCSQIFRAGYNSSGFYGIRLQGSPGVVRVYCDMSEDGGWTAIQRRLDGTEMFNRSWNDYKVGFGDLKGEFWLGNDNLHYLTAQGNYSLRINLKDFEGNQRYAEYRDFKVAHEKDKYQLAFGAYTGTAGDALSGNYEVDVSMWASHQAAKFSTYDRDNDNYTGNCAQEDKGGWWFNKCHTANLNGLYYHQGHYSAVTDDGIVWYTWKGWWYSFKATAMKLRPTDYTMDPIYDDPNTVHTFTP